MAVVFETGGGETNVGKGEGKEKSRLLPASWFGALPNRGTWEGPFLELGLFPNRGTREARESSEGDVVGLSGLQGDTAESRGSTGANRIPRGARSEGRKRRAVLQGEGKSQQERRRKARRELSLSWQLSEAGRPGRRCGPRAGGKDAVHCVECTHSYTLSNMDTPLPSDTPTKAPTGLPTSPSLKWAPHKVIPTYLHPENQLPPPAHHQPRPKKRQTVRYLPLAGARSPASDPCPGTPHTPPSTGHPAAQGCSCGGTVLQAGFVIPIAHLCDLGQVTSLGIRVFTYKTRDAVSAVGWA